MKKLLSYVVSIAVMVVLAVSVIATPAYAGFTISISDLKIGVKIALDGSRQPPYRVTDIQVTKGTTKAKTPVTLTKVKFENVVTGAIREETYNSISRPMTLELAEVDIRPVQYIYPDGNDYGFMDPASYEQITIPSRVVGKAANYLFEGINIEVLILNGEPISIELPPSVVLQVTSTKSVNEGSTAQGGFKPATLSTGLTVNVPSSVNEGDRVRIDTTEGKFLERVVS